MDGHEVGRGEYEDYSVLAVFADERDAKAFCDWWNLNNLDEAARTGRAHIAGRVPVYGPGVWKPARTSQIPASGVVGWRQFGGRGQ